MSVASSSSPVEQNPSKQAALRVRDVTVRLGGGIRSIFGGKHYSHTALNKVTFDVNRGEVLGVIGRNGAGKTSLLRILARIIAPDEGVVRSFGQKTCLLGLQTGFLKELTGRENAFLGGMLMGNTLGAMKMVIEDIKTFSELGEWFERPIEAYSAGMLARLGFSIAVFAEADIVLIDEVLGVGDSAFKEKSTRAFQEFLKKDGRSTIIVSHSLNNLMTLCDRILWLEQGKVMMVGAPQETIAAYEKFNSENGVPKDHP